MTDGRQTDDGRTAWALRGSRGSRCGAVRGGAATIRAKTVENDTITHPRLCRLWLDSIRWLPAFLRLVLVVRVFFFVVVFVAFVVFVVVFVFFFPVCGPFRGTRVVGERSHRRSPSRSCSNDCRLASSAAAAARAIATAFSHSSFCGSDLGSTPARSRNRKRSCARRPWSPVCHSLTISWLVMSS
jgi:hypothetical protein